MKQRLVGALVLLSGGIVLWSILFTGPAAYKVNRTTQIPPAPTIKEPKPIKPQRPESIPEVEEAEPLPEPPVPQITKTEAPTKATPETESPPKTSAETPTPEARSGKDAQPPKSKPAEAVDGMAKAWVIQIASFSNATNANNLKERLQAKGYKAYVQAATTPSGKSMQRVFVGPELNKRRAEQDKAEIESAFGVKALLHEFEP